MDPWSSWLVNGSPFAVLPVLALAIITGRVLARASHGLVIRRGTDRAIGGSWWSSVLLAVPIPIALALPQYVLAENGHFPEPYVLLLSPTEWPIVLGWMVAAAGTALLARRLNTEVSSRVCVVSSIVVGVGALAATAYALAAPLPL